MFEMLELLEHIEKKNIYPLHPEVDLMRLNEVCMLDLVDRVCDNDLWQNPLRQMIGNWATLSWKVL